MSDENEAPMMRIIRQWGKRVRTTPAAYHHLEHDVLPIDKDGKKIIGQALGKTILMDMKDGSCAVDHKPETN